MPPVVYDACMNLSEYIIQLGGWAKASKRLGINERTMRSWQYKARRPRPEIALYIVRKSRGAITMQDIYG